MKLKSLLTLGIIVALVFTGCTAKNTENEKKAEDSTANTKIIKTDELKDNLEKEDWLVVDTRSNDEYNGWTKDDTRGGHIKGATDFSKDFIDAETENKEERLEKALKDKGFTKEKNIVLYDTKVEDTKKVAKYLSDKGYKNLYAYDAKEWLKDESLPVESYQNYDMLVPAWWINDVINGKKPKSYSNDKFKVIEVSWGEESDSYNKGHIKGAVHMNTDDIEEAPIWNRKKDSELINVAKSYGLDKDTTAILYGEDPMASFRAAVILKYIGVKDVRVLNGGFKSWTKEGFEIETEKNSKKPVEDFKSATPLNKNYIIDIDKAKEYLKNDKENTLVDIRTWDEYIGKTPGYSDISIAGRPPKSVWGKAGTNTQNLDDYRNVDNTMKNSKDIIEMWKEQGIDKNKNLAFYCGTGWRAAEVLWYSNVMGLKNVSLYDGGWYEWIADPNNPIEKGEPKSK